MSSTYIDGHPKLFTIIFSLPENPNSIEPPNNCTEIHLKLISDGLHYVPLPSSMVKPVSLLKVASNAFIRIVKVVRVE
jgi:hypothetical protein